MFTFYLNRVISAWLDSITNKTAKKRPMQQKDQNKLSVLGISFATRTHAR
jgi:hypothetical protein